MKNIYSLGLKKNNCNNFYGLNKFEVCLLQKGSYNQNKDLCTINKIDNKKFSTKIGWHNKNFNK
tara:strand:- start:96 stop:287 length:192 start_codon:yes stop_codon:yes gene_type:complete